MTPTPDTAHETSPARAPLRIGIGIIVGLFALGIATGVTMSALERVQISVRGGLALLISVIVTGVSIWQILKGFREVPMPRSPRVRRSRITLYAAIGVSLLAGLFVSLTGSLEGDFDLTDMLFSPTPLSATLAAIMIAGWLVALGASAYWHSTLDEFERAKYEFGGTLALYAYIGLTPVWWLAWRAGLAPQVDGVLLFWIVCVVWSLGWLWRRNR